MSDGTRLRETWGDALGAAETNFRQLLASSSTNEWKHVPQSLPQQDVPSPHKGKSRSTLAPELTDVVVYRKPTRSGEYVYRAMLDVPAGEEVTQMDRWKAILTTAELRQEWDPTVEEAHFVEMFDRRTRISKTKFTLGWPANPRDAVTISRLYQDSSTIIDISTSLPRTVDEPSYLRPSPPYVRSKVALFAWWIQFVQPTSAQQPASPAEQIKRRLSVAIAAPRLRITCFWQHDLRSIWNFNSSITLCQHLSTMVLGLYKIVKTRGSRIPVLTGHGHGISIEHMRFQLDRQALTIEYAVHPEDGMTENADQSSDENGERFSLLRSIECQLPTTQGWDVQVSTNASSEKIQKLPWTGTAVRSTPIPPILSGKSLELFVFRIAHASLPDDHSILKVRVVVELSGPSNCLRLNGISQLTHDVEERSLENMIIGEQQQILQDASSAANVSLRSSSTVSSVGTIGSGSTPLHTRLLSGLAEKSTLDKKLMAQVKRSYIYFSSLLQEPEAKWKRQSEFKGVSVSQLDSIDPALVVYRAEAKFVGLGLWDLYSALVSPGARVFWDKQYDDATLLEDVNELTELWHFKTKPAWPVVGRDAVLLKTVYKSPTTIHVFSFSVDDLHLFPHIPPPNPSIIRTQVDLQGWAIEVLSPTTTQLTLLEQSDPKGWSNKAMTIPSQMTAAVVGVGDYLIKCGAPPVMTRLAGARATDIRYDHEKPSFWVAYEGIQGRRSGNDPGTRQNGTNGAMESVNTPGLDLNSMHTIDCQIRCDIEKWASALDIIVDPPPQSVTALRRHRLSEGGGGLWLTVMHDALLAADEKLLVIVRRGPILSQRQKPVVMLNGARIAIDVEELSEAEIQALNKRKRVNPLRIPLDQPPAVSVIRRRRAEWDGDESSPTNSNNATKPSTPEPHKPSKPSGATPNFSSSLASFWSNAIEQATSTTQFAAAAIAPAITQAPTASVPSALLSPVQHACEALHWLHSLEVHQQDGWTLVTNKGLAVHRKLFPEISPVIPVHKGEKVIEGVSAEEISSVLMSYDCRKYWDDRFVSAIVLERYGALCHTAFLASRCGFPFQDRGFYLASFMARSRLPQTTWDANSEDAGSSQDHRNVIFYISASFHPDSASSFSAEKYNSYSYPIGRTFIDGWVLETLDPYTKENYAIPSTRCTRIVAVDYAGSIPVTMNRMINAELPKSILAVETYVKGTSSLPLTRLPAAGFVLAEAKGGEGAASAVATAAEAGSPSWKFKRKDEHRTLLMSSFDPSTRVYISSIVLTTSSQNANSSNSDDSVSKASKTPPSRLGTTSDVVQGGRIEFPTSPSPTSIRPEALSSHINERGRSSSVFTASGQLKYTTDLVVAEIAVDTKLYPDGYDVQIAPAAREDVRGTSLLEAPLRTGDLQTTSENSTPAPQTLPFTAKLYTVPASPLHSAGLNTDRPPRHLLRLTLPTAQYQRSTFEDPLTEETRGAPPKPQWLLDLESKGFVVQVEIRPCRDAKRNGAKSTVRVDGTIVLAAGEKESLTAFGREELQDDRVSRMSVLQRLEEEGAFPDELKLPLARAEEYLLDRAIAICTADVKEGSTTPEVNRPKQDTEKNLVLESHENGGIPQEQITSPVPGGFLWFLNAYPNPLARWTSSAVKRSILAEASPSGSSSVKSDAAATISAVEDGAEGKPEAASTLSTTLMTPGTTYGLSTVLIIALIAFLIGSLLRSLLSPADFIYVVTDVHDAEEVSKGWREIRRLLEVKYIVGGWDFQIAVVRRH